MSIYKGSQFIAGTPDLTEYAKTTDLLNAIYPVGSVYIGTQSSCPLSSLISGSTWTLVSSGKALWTGNGSNANTTINAGLPNITGKAPTAAGVYKSVLDNNSGALYCSDTWNGGFAGGGGSSNAAGILNIDASKSNSIYGSSTTVQPPAYVVNVWRRTA